MTTAPAPATTETARLRVYACECGKWHCAAGTTVTSVCVCGRRLWRRMWTVGR